MSQPDKMLCPDCGVELNRHAEKIDYTAAFTEPGAVDSELGGVIVAAHTCPECGRTETRRANAQIE